MEWQPLRYIHYVMVSLFSKYLPLSYLLDSGLVRKRPVEDFLKDMASSYGKMDAGPRQLLPIMEITWLRDWRWRRCKDEYLVASVKGPDDILYYFAFERSGNINSEEQWDKKLRAKVTITILPTQQHKGDRIIGRLPLPCNLHELVILADLIQNHDPNLLGDRDWDSFIGKIMDTLEARLGRSVEENVEQLGHGATMSFFRSSAKDPQGVIDERRDKWIAAIEEFENELGGCRTLAESRKDRENAIEASPSNAGNLRNT